MYNIRLSKNLSYYFLMPLLARELGFSSDFGLVIDNTYICDREEYYEDAIILEVNINYICHNFEARTQAQNLFMSEYFEDSFEMNGSYYYVFTYPYELRMQYRLFQAGRYTEFELEDRFFIIHFLWDLYEIEEACIINWEFFPQARILDFTDGVFPYYIPEGEQFLPSPSKRAETISVNFKETKPFELDYVT